MYETFVESSYRILGILAGLNRLYFSAFHFKRQGQFIRQLQIAPDNLAERIESLFKVDYGLAVAELERLIEETVTLGEPKWLKSVPHGCAVILASDVHLGR